MSSPVYYFVPNLVGYTRVILGVAAFWVAFTNYEAFVWMYGISAFMDCIDGYTARLFKQSTKFGAVLDMVTDRACASCLLGVLARLYPEYSFWFLMSIGLDIMSHWAQMAGTYIIGGESHKANVTNPLLKFYYQAPYVLFIMVAGNEMCMLCMYLMYYSLGPIVTIAGTSVHLWVGLYYVSLPIFVLKNLINVVQFTEAMAGIAAYDMKVRNAAKAK